MKRERASGNAFAPWNETPSSRERPSDKVGRFATGRKGKRKVVVAHGIVVRDTALEAEADWWKDKGEGMKASPSLHYGTGATVYDTERRLGLTLPQSARIAGDRAKSELVWVPIMVESIAARNVMLDHNGQYRRVEYKTRYLSGEWRLRPAKSKPKASDRIAREMVTADKRLAKRETAQQRKAKMIRRMRKAAVGR